MNANGKNVRRLTNNPATDFEPTWSPDSRKIAFSFGGLNNEIHVMDADGKNQRNLTDSLTNDSGPAWSPDGRWIAFCSRRDGNDEIYVMDADGRNQRNFR